MTVLVTGCAGFIGSHLCEALLKNNERVFGVDAFTDYYDVCLKKQNISSFINHPKFELIEGDLVEDDIRSWLDGVDCIFHTAGQPGVRGSWGHNFNLYLRNNVLATQRILESVRESGKTIRIVYSSSSSVYGNTNELPTSEKSLPQPYSPYGTTKLAAEHLCSLYFTNYKIPTVSLRYFTVYGPRQRPDMGFHIFIKALLHKEPLVLYGDGMQTRDFTYVKDIVRANLFASTKSIEGMVFNVGGGARISLNEVLRILHRVSNMDPQIEVKESSKGDVRHTYANTLQAQMHLGFNPETSIERGLKEQFEWQRSLYFQETLV